MFPNPFARQELPGSSKRSAFPKINDGSARNNHAATDNHRKSERLVKSDSCHHLRHKEEKNDVEAQQSSEIPSRQIHDESVTGESQRTRRHESHLDPDDAR